MPTKQPGTHYFIPKGAIIDKNDVAQEICFKKSVQEANKLLQKHEPTRRRIHLVPVIETIDGDDSFEASQKGQFIGFVYTLEVHVAGNGLFTAMKSDA